MADKVALTGVTGQEGAYLARFLLGKGYTACTASSAAARRTPTAAATCIEVDTLPGDAAKARAKLGCQRKGSFQPLVREMLGNDRLLAQRDAANMADGRPLPGPRE